MARSSGSTIQEELYSPHSERDEEIEDARLLELDAEKESPFLRAQKRVPARRAAIPKKAASRLFWCVVIILIASVIGLGAASLYQYGEHSWRFRLESSDNIEVAGQSNVTRAQIMEVMGGDIGRNIFFVPLDRRQKQIEQIPWVESASVMRFAPDRIRIQIHERTPVAFARVGSKIMLADNTGALMDLSSKKKYSFPVIVGMSAGEPLSARGARMKIYGELIRDLDSGGGRYSQDLSEVDLSDPEDVKVLTNAADGEVLVHLGSSNYLERFKVYVAHLREWRQQFQKVDSVDLRYDRQIIVNPDTAPSAKQPALSASAAKAALSAGVKPTALISHPGTQSISHATVRPAVIKRPEKASHGQKRAAITKKAHAASSSSGHVRADPSNNNHAHTGVAPVRSSTVRLIQPAKLQQKTNAVPQKPSPAILKGQDSR
jgi:cell division protein FtsQ